MVLNSTMDGCSLQVTADIFQSTTDRVRIGGREFGRKPMAMLRVFGMTVAAGLMAGIASANAQDTSATYVVSHIEVAPSSTRNAAAVLRALRDASRKEAGNSGFEILQRIGQSQQFAILEVWRDTRAQAGHAAATDTAQCGTSSSLIWQRQLMSVCTPALWSASPKYPAQVPSMS
jgi:quinol monooxygenase YgiN